MLHHYGQVGNRHYGRVLNWGRLRWIWLVASFVYILLINNKRCTNEHEQTSRVVRPLYSRKRRYVMIVIVVVLLDIGRYTL